MNKVKQALFYHLNRIPRELNVRRAVVTHE